VRHITKVDCTLRGAQIQRDKESIHVNQLASVWMEDLTTEATRISVNKKIDNFVEGDLEHATEMLCALWEIANTDGDIKAPSNTLPVVSPFRFYLL
jgi:hypothetical protein